MSTSNWQNISYNIDLVKKLDPKRILDIGVGFGRWGMLFREFLEVWGDNNFKGKWSRVIDGVEIFPDYILPFHAFFYDTIFVEDAIDFIKETDSTYDLINCGDVIEHFSKPEAFEFIQTCLAKSRYLLINIPIGSNWEQGPVNNNEHERHLSVWEISDFKKYSNKLIKKFRDVELREYAVVLLSKDKINLNEAYGKHFKKKNILKNKLGLKKLVSRIEKK
ncbi:MAG: methyltransferase domain-containing protein [Ignavibacteria bacterium]|nr:methyltransferase domain-containing protein [Ignavibacteria bacterium]